MTSLTTPTPPAPRVRPKLNNRRRLSVAVVIVVVAIGGLLYQGLSSAATYFYTADQAVAHRSQQGTRRFRIEGAVVPGSVRTVGSVVDFTITNNDVNVDVVHSGGQPELFQPNIPVVLEGHWEGDHFASDLIMVRHSSSYRQQNPERVKNYQQ